MGDRITRLPLGYLAEEGVDDGLEAGLRHTLERSEHNLFEEDTEEKENHHNSLQSFN